MNQNNRYKLIQSILSDIVGLYRVVHNLFLESFNFKKQSIILLKTMGIFLSIYLFTILITSYKDGSKVENGAGSFKPLNKLKLMEGNYPRPFFFRQPEVVYYPYEKWDQNFSRLMGFEAKALEEEVPLERIERNPEFFSRFKKNHPEQMVLLHYDGVARKPMFESAIGKFFSGHWLYYAGVTITSDLPAEYGTTEIHVSDASQFFLNVGLPGRRSAQTSPGWNDDIGLCVLDENGKPDWTQSEQVTLVAVDYERNIISVKRGGFGTSPNVFKAGKSYAAVHCTAGPWGNDLLWAYNFSTACPKDQNGNTCSDILINDLAYRFSPEGELAAFDGIEFDIIYWDPNVQLNPKKRLGHTYKGLNRQIDANADGLPENGIINGMNIYGIGTTLFFKKLRERLGPDRIIMADGTDSHTQRAFGSLNGIESEGWPNGSDPKFNEWSDGINRLQFWNENSIEPRLTYINHRYWSNINSQEVGANQIRLLIAASTLTSTAYGMYDSVEKYFGGTSVRREEVNKGSEENVHFSSMYDEIIMGQENKLGWLGKPKGPSVLMAKQKQSVINFKKKSEWKSLVKRIQGPVELAVEKGALKITAKEKGADKLIFTIKDVPVNSSYLTLFMKASAAPMAGYPADIARLVWVNIPQVNKVLNRHMSWVNNKEFESVFYFKDIESEKVDITFEFENAAPVWITELNAYADGDVRYRSFENGVVLANPKSEPVDFNLAKLFPGQSFRRIQGSPGQDSTTNNGKSVTEDIVTLKGLDALFLIKK